MKRTYILDSDSVVPFTDYNGKKTGEYEVTVDIDLEDVDDDVLIDHVLQLWNVKGELLEQLTIEDIQEAISHHSDRSGRWEYIDKPKLEESIH